MHPVQFGQFLTLVFFMTGFMALWHLVYRDKLFSEIMVDRPTHKTAIIVTIHTNQMQQTMMAVLWVGHKAAYSYRFFYIDTNTDTTFPYH